MKNLFERYENINEDEKLKIINIQAIIILVDKFRTLIHSLEKVMDNNEEDMNRNNGYNIAQGQGVKMQGYDFGYLMQQGQQNMNNNMN